MGCSCGGDISFEHCQRDGLDSLVYKVRLLRVGKEAVNFHKESTVVLWTRATQSTWGVMGSVFSTAWEECYA